MRVVKSSTIKGKKKLDQLFLPELLRGFAENDTCSDFTHAVQEYETRWLKNVMA